MRFRILSCKPELRQVAGAGSRAPRTYAQRSGKHAGVLNMAAVDQRVRDPGGDVVT